MWGQLQEFCSLHNEVHRLWIPQTQPNSRAQSRLDWMTSCLLSFTPSVAFTSNISSFSERQLSMNIIRYDILCFRQMASVISELCSPDPYLRSTDDSWMLWVATMRSKLHMKATRQIVLFILWFMSIHVPIYIPFHRSSIHTLSTWPGMLSPQPVGWACLHYTAVKQPCRVFA